MPLIIGPTHTLAGSEELHISTRFDDSVHEYLFAHSQPQLFAQLQRLIAAKYPLTPLYIHYTDEDGDMVRVTSEAELREAVRVCGSRLSLVLSSGRLSSNRTSNTSYTMKASSTRYLSAFVIRSISLTLQHYIQLSNKGSVVSLVVRLLHIHCASVLAVAQ